MTDHTVIAILVGVIALLAAAIGYGLGEHRTTLEKLAEHDHAIAENRQRLRAQGALIQVVAEDYEPPEPEQETPEQRRRRMYLIEGEGAGAIVAVLFARLRRHKRSLASAAVAASVASLTAAALLAHGSPPPRHPAFGPSPHGSPSSTVPVSPSPAPSAPITKPGRMPHRSLPPAPLPPLRRRTPQPEPSPVRSTAPPSPRPTPQPTRPRPKPSGSPTPTCLLTVSLRGILEVCL